MKKVIFLWLGLGILIGILKGEGFYLLKPVRKSTGKSELIPLNTIKTSIQKSWNNPASLKWGNSYGIASVLGPSDLSLIKWDSVLGYSGNILYGLWNNYDPNQTIYILSGINPEDTFAVFFQSPAPCTLVAFGVYNLNRTTDPTADFTFFSAWSAPGVDPHPENPWNLGSGTYPDTMGSGLGWYLDYHYGYDYPGPSPFYDKNWITAPTYQTGPPSDSAIHMYIFYPDLGPIDNPQNKPFWIGWVPHAYSTAEQNAEPWIPITVNYGEADWHSWIYKRDLSYFGISPGWYNQWHGYWMDAFVWVYGSSCVIDLPQLPSTYSTGPFNISVHIFDHLGIFSRKIVACSLETYAIPSSPTPVRIPFTLVSGDSIDGIWEATFGPYSPGDTVYYYIFTFWSDSSICVSDTNSFIILEIDSSKIILFVAEENNSFVQKAYEILNYLADYTDDSTFNGSAGALFWDIYQIGLPDSSVLHINKFKAVFWTGLSASGFAQDTVYIKNYLDNGGNLFVSSQDIAAGGFHVSDYTTPLSLRENYPNHFLVRYMKMDSVLDDVRSQPPYDTLGEIHGFPGDPISDPSPPLDTLSITNTQFSGFAFPYDFNDNSYDTVFPCWFYEENLNNREDGTPAGYWYDGTQFGDTYKLIFFYFNYEYILDSLDLYEITRRILKFFGFPVSIEEKTSYKPSKPLLSLKVSSIAELGKVTVSYTLPSTGELKLGLYNVSGRLIRSLFHGRKKIGTHTISFITDKVKPGVYFIKLEFNGREITQKIVFVK